MLLSLLAGAATAPCVSSEASEEKQPIRGLPFTRTYALEEIGNVSRGARLGFDAFGRLAVIQQGAYAVLNQSSWMDMAEKAPDAVPMVNVAHNPQGAAYYGSLGSWGVVEVTSEGLLRPRPIMPPTLPKWVLATSFNDIAFTHGGVIFSGRNGAVFFDPRSQRHAFFEVPKLARLFLVGDDVFVSAHGQKVQRLDLATGNLTPLEDVDVGGAAIELATPLDAAHVLVATMEGRLFVFDGERVSPWVGQLRNGLSGRVTSLQRLIDGDTAVAINGQGLLLISDEGVVDLALTGPEYHRISYLATREPGVLWAATEGGVERILYRSPVSIFGQRLGLPVSWPLLVRWRDRIVVASGGRLYESSSAGAGAPAVFRAIKDQPAAGSWALASRDDHLLVGNDNGVFAAEADGRFTQVLSSLDVAFLALGEEGLCYVFGSTKTAVLRWTDGRWEECAPRVPAAGAPTVVQATRKAAWVEFGPNRAARVSLKDGRLHTRVFDSFPWTDPVWVNVGIVGDTVVLNGPRAGRIFFDERSEELFEAPRLQQLFEQAPCRITRLREDETGTLWAAHEQGVLKITPREGGYDYDTTTFDIVNERSPFIHILGGSDVWISTGQSLFHVDRRSGPDLSSAFRPVLVSVLDARTGTELYNRTPPAPWPREFRYAENNLGFRFFAGSYAALQSPVYEFRLDSHREQWTTLGTGSLLNLPELREGRYRLDVRVTGAHGPLGAPVSYEFQVRPPWYRTWFAYALYILGGGIAIRGLMRWAAHRAHRRNLALEKLVQERTEELTATMEKLNDETRNAATLAERDRLAGEIHDSLQQGLSGLMLQLDATLKLPGVSPEVRSRLSVARNMVSFTRHEVQHAVWDMESPVLAGTELGEALRKITAQISPGTAQVDIRISGDPVALSPSTKHHLLRIAQEALTNAVRHAAPSMITISLVYGPEEVELSITDDGLGFVPEDVLARGIGHFGLRGLRGRASKISGRLLIQSSPGKGTSITILAPLAAAHSQALQHAFQPAS